MKTILDPECTWLHSFLHSKVSLCFVALIPHGEDKIDDVVQYSHEWKSDEKSQRPSDCPNHVPDAHLGVHGETRHLGVFKVHVQNGHLHVAAVAARTDLDWQAACKVRRDVIFHEPVNKLRGFYLHGPLLEIGSIPTCQLVGISASDHIGAEALVDFAGWECTSCICKLECNAWDVCVCSPWQIVSSIWFRKRRIDWQFHFFA